MNKIQHYFNLIFRKKEPELTAKDLGKKIIPDTYTIRLTDYNGGLQVHFGRTKIDCLEIIRANLETGVNIDVWKE